MQYKTIALDLLKQYPENRSFSGSSLSKMEALATRLRETHLAILEELKQRQPNQSDLTLKSEAMELALQEIQDELASSSDNVT